ncbi:ATP-binding protein [Bosea sp. 117]|uniref:PAS domain-containing sensor histidine kinase n=1 Tax=Bosea sp. 117 TaxID=1125973 RepID=UPI000494575C|nr:ATP-binding protein [Bosea sp. 117]
MALALKYRYLAAALLTVAIFAVDSFTMLGSAVAVLYVLVLIIIGDIASERMIRVCALGCVALTVLSYVYVHGTGWHIESTLRLTFSLAAILATTFLTLSRRASNRALRQSEGRFRTIFETLAVAIWEHDLRPVKAALDELAGRGINVETYLAEHPEFVRRMRGMIHVTDVNRTALKLMGAPSKEAFFTRLDEFLLESDNGFSEFLIALASGAPSYQNEATIRTLKGETLRVIVAFNFPPEDSLDRVQASVLDISERVKVQQALDRTRAQLDHALRAATVGEVSASIAHEINQPLAAITTHAAAAQRWMDRDPPDLDEVRASLNEAAASAHRASEVVRRVRTLLAKVEPERAVLALDPLVADALRMVNGEIVSHGVRLTASLDAPDARIEGDRILLQQVLINVMNNAIQAMQAAPGERRLSVRTFRKEGGVAIEVTDTGPGFSGDAAERAFDPFFTTKPHGMGLGLAMCRSIVQAHRGEIGLGPPDSGAGGRILIQLPLAA